MSRFLALALTGLCIAAPAFAMSTSQSLTAVGTCGTASSGALMLGVDGFASAAIDVSGTFAGTLAFEASINGTTYFPVSAYGVGAGAGATTTTAPGQWSVPVSGFKIVCVAFSPYTSGTATVTINVSPAQGTTFATSGVGAVSTTIRGPSTLAGVTMVANTSNGITGLPAGATVWIACNTAGNFRQGAGTPVAVSTDFPLPANTPWHMTLGASNTAVAIITAAAGTCWINQDAQ